MSSVFCRADVRIRRNCVFVATVRPNQFTDLVFTPSRRPAVASLTEGFGWHAIIMRDYCWTESYLSPLSAGSI